MNDKWIDQQNNIQMTAKFDTVESIEFGLDIVWVHGKWIVS